jgi:hypothetical protein
MCDASLGAAVVRPASEARPATPMTSTCLSSFHPRRFAPSFKHRLFPHVTQSCRSVIFQSVETARHYMEKTRTTKDLKVAVGILDKAY